jgi:RNA polymerase sigma-70 factor (ECF subfamily)
MPGDGQLRTQRDQAAAVEPDDATLVASLKAGDPSAFCRLYERHKLPLFRTALAMTHDQGVAEELLQEAFLRALRHVQRIDLAPGASLRPWLHRILINLVYDWSARQRFVSHPLEAVIDRLHAPVNLSPEKQMEQRELEHVVGEAIDQLPFGQRIVVILYYVHDLDLAEIAAILNVPTGTVKSRLYYGRARLRERLEADARLPVRGALGYATNT